MWANFNFLSCLVLRPNDDEKMEDAGFVGEYENPFDEIEKDLLEEEED